MEILAKRGWLRRIGRVASVALAMAIAFTAVLPTVGGAPATAYAAKGEIVEAAVPGELPPLPPEMIPPDLGQAGFQVYVRKTGHTIRGQMLDYWRANGATAVYGDPISEPFGSPNGYYSQAFEKAIFEFLPEHLWSELPYVRLMPISEIAFDERLGDVRRDGRRGGGGGDRRHAAWRALDPTGNSAARAVNDGGVYVEATGHTITGDFLSWYNSHEGTFYLGNPLSQPIVERGVTVQYFDGGALMRNSRGGVVLLPLAKELARTIGFSTKRMPRGDLPEFRESLFTTAPNPNPQGDPDALGRKWIEVDISQQTLWAYQGGTLVSQTLISTGIAPNNTEQGLFHVRYKLEKETMSGFTSSTGEVVGLGDGSGEQSGIEYEVKDVPNVMYINDDAEALHGAYWHNNFGVRMSHGCINLPLPMAAFLFGWAPLGTMVWVHG